MTHIWKSLALHLGLQVFTIYLLQPQELATYEFHKDFYQHFIPSSLFIISYRTAASDEVR
jgi:hypothetical protein